MRRMQNLVGVVLIVVTSACEEPMASTETLHEQVDQDAVLIHFGNFENGPYGNVNGKARIYKSADGKLHLQLEEFRTTNGPDLYVYLSKEIMPVHFVDLGKLKSTNGNQVYAITGMPDFETYRYVCIHCKQYNHLFGFAKLD
jgi:hypothetical protein